MKFLDVRPGSWAVAACCVLFALQSCCTRTAHWRNPEETLLNVGIHSAEAPSWLSEQVPEEPDSVYFIGRSVGYNVLDERAAFDQARDHALEQYAMMIRAEVHVEAASGEAENSSRYLPFSPARQNFSATAAVNTCAVAGDLVEVDSHWERYKLDGDCCGNVLGCDHVYTRYKCWVLMKVARDRVPVRIEETQIACVEPPPPPPPPPLAPIIEVPPVELPPIVVTVVQPEAKCASQALTVTASWD